VRDFVAVAAGVPYQGRAEREIAFAKEAELLVVDPGGVAVLLSALGPGPCITIAS
jgi:hypothetical protein